MARAKSPEKRQAILDAAVKVIAEQGLEAATAKIAKLAGIAEGSLFTYFETKDELLNQLYRELKQGLNAMLRKDFPEAGKLKERAHHVWDRYLDWGASSAEKRKVMALLKTSERVTEATRSADVENMEPITKTMQEVGARGVYEGLDGFAYATLTSLAEATAEKIYGAPKMKKTYRDAGFEIFWRATK